MDPDADFWKAIRTGDRRTVESIVAARPSLVTARHEGASALLIARYHGRHDVVASLRAHIAELDIFEACALGGHERVQKLFGRNPALANAVAEDGFGPLGLASFFSHEPVVRLLLERGARVDTPSSNAMRVMPLHSAAAARSVPIARLLLARGAPVNARQGADEMGFTPLMEGALNGQTEMVDLLLDHGADRNMRDDEGLTAGDHARQNGHTTLAERLA